MDLSRTGAAAAAALILLTIAACSSSSPASSTASAPGSAAQPDCTTISDILSDGPDPDADPVGYAEAQVRPLRQLKISDARLSQDVLALATAYAKYSSAGGATAAAAVAQAEKAVNTICPEAAP